MKLEEAKKKMEQAIDFLSDQFIGLHHSGITSGLIDTIKADHYGQLTPIKFLATTSDSSNRISAHVHDPADVPKIVAALKKNGFEAYLFSKMEVVVNRPPPSGEDRTKVESQIKKMGEDTKVSVRSIRKKFKKSIDPETSKNEKKSLEKRIQKLTDEACKMIDGLVKEKIGKI